jgi:2-polyprenyl-3-methyl-5-hydroxy-6-metoxy-1,4-benzoquinol methylase
MAVGQDMEPREFGVKDPNEYWSRRESQGKTGERRLHRFLSNLVDEMFAPGAKVLDCGVGSGHVFRLCSQKHDTYGVEISSAAIAMHDAGTEKIKQADLNNGIPSFGINFDVIVASMILHWLTNPLEFLLRAKGMLSSRGCIILVIPNITFYRYRIAYLFGKFPPISQSHKNFQVPSEVERMFGDAGLKIDKRLSPRHSVRARFAPTLFSTDIVYVLRPE